MKLLYRDRVSGVSTVKDPLSTYGPGNMLDNSNRNQWVSSWPTDTITVSCNNQVDSFFVGRTRADTATYSFFGKALSVSSLTSSGTLATVVTSSDHKLYTGDRIRVTSSNQAALNIDNIPIRRINATKFTYYAASASSTLTSAGHIIKNYQRSTAWSIQSDASSDKDVVTSIAASSGGLATITTGSAHGLVRSDVITFSSTSKSDYDGLQFIVLSVPSTTTFIITSSSSQTADEGNVEYFTTYYDTSTQFLSSNSLVVQAVDVLSGSLGTCTITAASHGLLTGDMVRVKAATTSEVNVDGAIITVDGTEPLNKFSFSLLSDASAAIELTTSTPTLAADVVITKYDGTNVLNSTAFAVRYVNNLSDFVQGNFINAVSAYTSLPYNDDTSELELKLSATIDRAANIATHFLLDTVTTSTPVTTTEVAIDATNTDYGPQALLKMGSSQGWAIGDLLSISGITTTTGINGIFPLSARVGWDAANNMTAQGVASGGFNNYWYATNTTGSPGGTASIGKVTALKGRFVREPYSTVSTISWNGTTGVGSVTFSSNHGLVNNDKIIIKGTGILNLDGTYLVTYSTALIINFTITKQSTSTISSIGAASGGYSTVTTSATHSLSVGDIIFMNASHADHDQEATVVSVPTTTSFTYAETSSNTSNSGTIYKGTYKTSSVGTTNENISYVAGTHVVARPINIPEFKEIVVGSLIEYNQNDDMSFFIQIKKIIGDGTAENDIDLDVSVYLPYEDNSSEDAAVYSGAPTTQEFPIGVDKASEHSAVRLPVTAGILRAGFSLQFPNAQIGLSEKLTDYSIKKELATGSYYFLNRDSAREYTGKIVDSASVIDNFVQFAQEFLGEPFPALVLQDMNLDEKTALYAYFPSLPTISFSNKTDAIREASFALKEVL